jgi:TatD DNase family protein
VLVDTHCHFSDPQFDPDRPQAAVRAREAGVGHVVVVAESETATWRAIECARQFGWSATAGVHPHEASTWSSDVASRVAAALEDPTVVAVGETGLDYHYDHSPREAQRRSFAAQLELGARYRRPVVIHAREADDDMAAMLADASGTFILHSFSSGPAVFEAGLAAGAYFSFSGMVTFRTWTMADRVRACPADRLLVETDAPYLAPVPHRGRRNEPAFVREVAARVAELRGETFETVVRQTGENAARLFGSRVLTAQTLPGE